MKSSLTQFILVLLASAFFGLVTQDLVMSKTVGLNLSVMCVVGAAILVVLDRKKLIDPDLSIWYLVAVLAVAAYGFGVPDSRNLVQLNGVVAFLATSYFCFRVSRRRALRLDESIVQAPFFGLFAPFAGFFVPFFADWSSLKTAKRPRFARGIILGAICAIPFLGIFGAVLSQADPVFERMFQFKFDFDLDMAVRRFFFFAVACCCFQAVISFLSAPIFARLASVFNTGVTPNPNAPPVIESQVATTQRVKTPQDQNDHVVMFVTFFGLISLLFVLFMFIQVRYLFGGNSVVWNTQGLTYAAYAKRGFLEIATVEMLCLPLLVIGQYALRNHDPKIRKVINAQAVVIIGLLLMLMASAAFRLKLYVDAYGMTPLRFYVAVGMIWMLLLLGAAWRLGVKWQLDRLGKFVYASLVAMTFWVNLLRPDYWIARINLTRKTTLSLDPDMVTQGGADAYSAIMQFAGDKRTLNGTTTTLRNKFMDNQRRRSHDWRDMTVMQYLLPKS